MADALTAEQRDWVESAYRAYTRNNPLGPARAAVLLILLTNLAKRPDPLWELPDDPLEDWANA